MNFDADSGIKRRLIHFEFRNKFVALQDLEKERINHKIGKVFALDNSLVSKFHNNDSYKNALIHILIKKAKQYFDNGLTIPDKYVEIAKEICEENDKFKNFFENHFEITNKDEDRIAKDELRDMYNSYTKCNFSASSIMTDIQRLQLKYERGLRCVYNNVSLRGVIVGIKKLTGKVEPNKPEVKHSDLDFGLEFEPEPEITHNSEYTEELEKDLREKNNQFTELQIEHDNLKKEFEAMKLKLKEIEKQNQRPDPSGMEKYYYNLWFETLSEEEQKVELQIRMSEKKSYVEEESDEEIITKKKKPKSPPRSIEIEESDEEKVVTKKKSKSPPKSVISMIDDSDDEDEKVKPVNAKDHKIIKALECDFID